MALSCKPICHASEYETQSVKLDERYDLKPLFPTDLHYYRFSGSLTTPPCTEGLRWLVMKNPVTLSAAQLAQFQKALAQSNNRPVQPLNGRMVVE
ncbi:carbonic anhydrase family protein [Erwinia aphidicola]|nr:carbonic anhydrase family protein [Erwinia aphidicola]